MIRTHLYGAFYGTRAALRHMTPARSGAIVNISSVLGLVPSPGAPDYSAAKDGHHRPHEVGRPRRSPPSASG